MRVSIIKPDNTVYIDGVPKPVDCSFLPPTFHALQWEGNRSGTAGEGEVEYSGKPKPQNEEVTDISAYMVLVEAWFADEPAQPAA